MKGEEENEIASVTNTGKKLHQSLVRLVLGLVVNAVFVCSQCYVRIGQNVSFEAFRDESFVHRLTLLIIQIIKRHLRRQFVGGRGLNSRQGGPQAKQWKMQHNFLFHQ